MYETGISLKFLCAISTSLIFFGFDYFPQNQRVTTKNFEKIHYLNGSPPTSKFLKEIVAQLCTPCRFSALNLSIDGHTTLSASIKGYFADERWVDEGMVKRDSCWLRRGGGGVLQVSRWSGGEAWFVRVGGGEHGRRIVDGILKHAGCEFGRGRIMNWIFHSFFCTIDAKRSLQSLLFVHPSISIDNETWDWLILVLVCFCEHTDKIISNFLSSTSWYTETRLMLGVLWDVIKQMSLFLGCKGGETWWMRACNVHGAN